MRSVLHILIILFISKFTYAQETKITIDYTVDYAILTAEEKPKDTISIGFSKDGKYLWSSAPQLVKSLSGAVFNTVRNKGLIENGKSNIILNTEENKVILFLTYGENEFFMNLKIPDLLASDDIEFKATKEFELLSEKTGEETKILNRKGIIYNIFPSNKPEDKIAIAFDESLKVDNNQIFSNIFRIIMASESNEKINGLVIPEGLILQIFEKDKAVLEAINIDTTKKTLTINQSFKISQ